MVMDSKAKPDAAADTPRGVRLAVAAALGLLIAGAAYLIVMRGDALIVDLAGLTGRIFCF